MIFATVLIAAIAVAPVASTPTGQAIIQKCWEGRGHPAMTDCVTQRAATARSELAEVERLIRKSLEKQRKPALATRFISTAGLYQRYRTQQCQLQEIFASAGNGSVEIGMACEAALDLSRYEQLKAAFRWLEPAA